MTDWRDRTISVALGSLRQGRDGDWGNMQPITLRGFLDWLTAPDTASHEKEGDAFLQGAIKAGSRKRPASDMMQMELVAFDVESGEQAAPIACRASQLGLSATIHPSFNDNRGQTRIKTDDVRKHYKLGMHEEATSEQVLTYWRNKKGILPEILETAKCSGRDGFEYVLEHAPFPRFRVVVGLREPVTLSSLSPTLAGAKERWSTFYRAAAAMLGIKVFDASCADVSRLFFYHRRPVDARNWAIRIVGRAEESALDFHAVLAATEATKKDTQSPKDKASAPTAESSKAEYKTEGFARFFAICAKHFNAADFLLAYGDDPVEANGGVQARCPNEDAHTEPDPPGKRPLWAMNAADSQHGVFVLKCQHQTCQSTLKGGHYVDLLCRANGLTVDDLVRDFVDDDGQKAWADAADDFVRDQNGKILSSQGNIALALATLGVGLSFNTFNGKTIITRDDRDEIVQDHHIVDVWLEIDRTFRFKPSKEFFFDVVGSIARERKFHPVCDYLDRVQASWDGVPRVEKLFCDYFGAVDTEFNRAAAKCWMVAAVRRVRQPGVKFDEMIVVESPQGKGKSSALAVLAVRPEWFSDALRLGAEGKEVIELTRGKWLIEIAELHGMRKGEIEKIKAQLSRQHDEARLAYGRITEHVPRQFVFAGTSNNQNYLKDATGNRRFWPVETGDIDLAALTRDVDQLWGEATTMEAAGEAIRLDKSLWSVAAAVQEQREAENPYLDVLRLHFADIDGRVRSLHVYDVVGVPLERRHQGVIEQVQAAMAKLGWEKKSSIRFGKNVAAGYVKGDGLRAWSWCGVALSVEAEKLSMKRGADYKQRSEA